MAVANCNTCEVLTCSCPIPVCKDTLILGTVTAISANVFIWVKKQNGAEIIQAFTTPASGEVRLDLTDPSQAFYNEFDGQYQIWVSDATGYICEEDRLTMRQGASTATTWAVNFQKAVGSAGGSINIKAA